MIENQYPIGPFVYNKDPDPSEKEQLIKSMDLLPSKLKVAVENLNDEQLDTPYREGGWTVRQVVHHLADAHLNGYLRFKWAVTEDRPKIKDYSQDLWADTDDARMAAPDISLELLKSIHRRWVAFLRTLPEDAYRKIYLHPDAGEMSLNKSLMLYEWHGRHHTEQIKGLRRKKGW